ncbi:MAG: type II secretion system major pseudopilin GspG [Gammaproteobacteria bacterium]|nr:type II secretion system major pseudopilin GspG [Gammaproteobacteria bacterium]
MNLTAARRSVAGSNFCRPNTSHRRAQRQHGFTLIEIMVVVVILGILAAIVVPRIMSRPDDARIAKAKQDIRVIESALELYRLDNFYYPSTQQGLEALVQQPGGEPPAKNWKPGGYLKSMPKDPWDRPYQYLNPGSHGEYDIYSLGADGTPGGDGVNADLGNWAAE